MKSAQWFVLLAVVTAMVFGISFAISYMPMFKSSGPKIATRARLTFVDTTTSFPPQPEGQTAAPPPVEFEIGKSRTHDFWFQNENGQDLPVGIFSKTCQCTSVLLWIAPGGTPMPAEDQRAEVPNGDGSSLAAAKLESSATRTELKEREDPTVVPAGAVGWVRLTWKSDPKNDRDLRKTLKATLWMGERGAGPNQEFVVDTIVVPPVRVSSDFSVPALSLDELPKTIRVPCYSATRPAFPLKVEQLHSRWVGESNPFEILEPVAMTAEELAAMRKAAAGRGVVLAGYYIPIVLNPRSKDGKTPLDVGPFRLHLQLKTEDAAPVDGAVKGWVRGDLGPVDESALPVRFAPFNSTQEVSEQVEVESGADVARLELDRDRTPDFLTVDAKSLSDYTHLSGGRKTWRLTVKWVPSSRAVGVFPRDEEGYRDSAVYVRPVYEKPGATPPCLCIPVTGKADTP